MNLSFGIYQMRSIKISFSLLAMAFVLGGCATNGDPRDPFEPVNRGIYHINDAVDTVVTKPIALAYRDIVPPPARTGVSNFFSNIDDIFVTGNNLLQGKVHTAASDFARLLTNTTLGLGGLFDVASHFGLEKHNEDFGQTLGVWGVGDGPFLMIPLYGPSTVRDAIGSAVQVYLDPVWNIDNIPTRNSLVGLRFVSTRANLLDAEKVLDTAALDPYTFLRDAYLQQRRSLIYDGNPPREKLSDLDEAAPKQAETPATDKAAEAAPVVSEPVAAAPAADIEKAQEKTETTAQAEPADDNPLSKLVAWLFSGGDVTPQE